MILKAVLVTCDFDGGCGAEGMADHGDFGQMGAIFPGGPVDTFEALGTRAYGAFFPAKVRHRLWPLLYILLPILRGASRSVLCEAPCLSGGRATYRLDHLWLDYYSFPVDISNQPWLGIFRLWKHAASSTQNLTRPTSCRCSKEVERKRKQDH